MDYRNFEKYLSDHTAPTDFRPSKMMTWEALGRTILFVGEDASDICAYFSSIMDVRGASHFTYFSSGHLEARNRFIINGDPSRPRMITDALDKLINVVRHEASAEVLSFTLALYFGHFEEGYSLACVSEDLLERLCAMHERGECAFPPIVIFCSEQEEYPTLPSGTRIFKRSGTLPITISRVGLLETVFYCGSEELSISSPEPIETELAAFAATCARGVFGATHSQIYRGLSSACPPNAARICSVVPPILLKVGDAPVGIPSSLGLTVFGEADGDAFGAFDRALFYGRQPYVEHIRQNIDLGKYKSRF